MNFNEFKLIVRMRQDRSIDFSLWTTRFKDRGDFNKTLKMFAPKTQTSNSTFYTELESDEVADRKSDLNESKECVSKESDQPDQTIARDQKQEEYDGPSFHKIASFGSFSRFRSFVMSAGSSAERIVVEESDENSMQVPFVRVSRGVLEYRNSR